MKVQVLSIEKTSTIIFTDIREDYLEIMFLNQNSQSYLKKRVLDENPNLFFGRTILLVKKLKGGKVKYK